MLVFFPAAAGAGGISADFSGSTSIFHDWVPLRALITAGGGIYGLALFLQYVSESISGCQTIMSIKKAADLAAFFNEEERRGV